MGLTDTGSLYASFELPTATYSGVARNFVHGGSTLFGGGGGSTNSVEDRGQRERGSGAVAP
jgi:hypothetical protein